MDPTAIISEIETIRLNDFQVCQKISLMETQMNRLNRTERISGIDTDSIHWFRIMAENEQLAIQKQQIENFSKHLCLQFDSEIRKLDEESDRQVERFRQEVGCDDIREKVAKAHEVLTQSREDLAILRQQQAELREQIEIERQRQKSDDLAIADIVNFLKFGRALRQRITRVNVSQNQLRALERRIAIMKTKSARPGQTPPNTGGSRILQSFQDVNAVTTRPDQRTIMAATQAPGLRTCNDSMALSSVVQMQGSNAGSIQAKQIRQPVAAVVITPSSMQLPEPPTIVTKATGPLYDSDWDDDIDFVDITALSKGDNPIPARQQVYSLIESDDDSAIYMD